MLKNWYYKFIYPNKKLHFAVLPFAIFIKFLLDHLIRFPRQLLTIDLVRMVICMPRFIFFWFILRYRRVASFLSSDVSSATVEHNVRGVGEISAPRSHMLIRPLLSVQDVIDGVDRLKVLTIGPRVEGELYNLMGYGFRSGNISAIDLFSYSPKISVGDMHDMQFRDGEFDVLLSGWVLPYSDQQDKAVAEMLRVLKVGGILSIGVAYPGMSSEDVVAHVGRKIGSDRVIDSIQKIIDLFGVHEKDIIFKSDGSVSGVNGAPIILIFRKSI